MALEAEGSGEYNRPGCVTGTSSEFVYRPLPRIVRDRRVVFLLGPRGAGKSAVARIIAGPGHVRLGRSEIDPAMHAMMKTGRWSDDVARSDNLVVDGPTFMEKRHGAARLLIDLARARAHLGRRTLFCQVEDDASVYELVRSMEAGSAAVVVLRFPNSRRARRRCAQRLCEAHGWLPEIAKGSERLDPWGYDQVMAWLTDRAFGGSVGSGHR